MHAADDRPEFAPPPEPALIRAFGLAVLAHLVLLFALMVGLRWQRQAPDAVAEAELWSALPQEAAPKPVPAPPPPPAPAPPPPAPQPVVKAPPPPPVQKQVDINIEREKQRKLEEQRRQAELQRQQEEQKRKLEAQKKREQELAQKKLEQQKLAEDKRRADEQKRKDEEKLRKQQETKLAQERTNARKDMLARMQAMAGATGSQEARGNALHSAGPSASWGAKVQAKVRPKIAFDTASVSGNPEAEIEVRTSPDGTIIAKHVVHSSGVPSWDEAVLRALDKTESLPRDIDGHVPSPVVIGFKPKG